MGKYCFAVHFFVYNREEIFSCGCSSPVFLFCFHNRFLFLPIIFSLFCMNSLHITVTVPGSYTGVHVFHIFRIKVSEGISSNRETKFAKAKKKKKKDTPGLPTFSGLKALTLQGPIGILYFPKHKKSHSWAAYILRIEVPHVIRSNRKTKFAKTQKQLLLGCYKFCSPTSFTLYTIVFFHLSSLDL